MKKLSIKLISIILALTLSIGFFVGCDNGSVPPIGPETPTVVEGAYLVEKANSDYVIVISENASDLILTAAIELQTLFAEATGVMLSIETDQGKTHSEDNKYLSIGSNALTTSAGLAADEKDIKNQGFYIKTKDKSIYMLGATDRGSLYAVYEFLALEFNFDHYFTDLHYIDTNITDKALTDYDVTEIPDIDQMTVPNVGYMQYNSINANRFRVVQIADWSIPQNTYNNVHNIFQIIPYTQFSYKIENGVETYGEHPAWYSDAVYNQVEEKWETGKDGDSAQACFCAHTELSKVVNPYQDTQNPTEYDKMLDEFLSVIQKGIKKTDAQIFTISQRDNKGFCSCDYCKDATKVYGAASSVLVLLCNNLSDKMNEWFETEEGAPYKRDFKILFLAYQDVEGAPVVYDSATKNYVASAPEMYCRENVGVYIASLGIYNTFDFTHEKNASIKENILAWRTLTNKFAFWTYDVNFQNYFYPYDSYVIRQELYKLLAESGTMVLNDQGQTQNIGSCTAWDNLKSYLSTKLRWDTDADLNALTKRYFEVCYKTASDTMYSLYLQYRAHANDVREKLASGYYEGSVSVGNIGDIFGGIAKPEIWQKPTMVSWYNQYLYALEQLEPLKETDMVGYEKAYQMVCAELVSPLYILIALHGDTYSPDTLLQMKRDFKSYCTIAGINSYYDSTAYGGIENLYKDWGIE